MGAATPPLGDHTGQPRQTLTTILILISLPSSALAALRQTFPTVYYHPPAASSDKDDLDGRHWIGPTPSFDNVPPSEWETAEVLLIMAMPAGLTDRRKQMPKLRWLQTVPVGINWLVQTDFIKNEPVHSDLIITNSSGVQSLSIAQHAFMLVLAIYHNLAQYLINSRVRGVWTPLDQVPKNGTYIPDVRGQTIGILGYGGIGREVGRIAAGWGMRVLACNSDGRRKPQRTYVIGGTGDPNGDLPEAWYASKDRMALQAFLSASDVLVLALPASPATDHIISASTLALLKPSAVLVNIARGDLIDQAALLDALDGARLAGAGLDVATPEPLPDDHPLLRHERCLVTPHVSWGTIKYRERLVDLVLINWARLAKGVQMYNEVNLKRGY